MLRLPADQHGPFVLLLVEPGCRACEELAAELSAHPWDMADVPLVMVLPAEDPQSPVLAAAGRQVVWQSGGAAAAALGVAVSPVAFAVDAAGLVAGRGIPGGMEDLVGLAQQARGGQQVSEPVRP